VTALALLVSGLLIVVTAAIRAAGASLVRTPRADALHDAAEGDARAGAVAALLDDRAGVQPALSPVLTTLNVVAAITATWALTRELHGWALALSLIVMVAVLVLATDVIPRTWGRRHPGLLAYRFHRLLTSAAALGSAANDFADDLEDDEDEADTAEIEAQSVAAERELISSILEFTDTIVREVMVPRPDMITIPATATTDQALDIVIAEGRSRIPVTGEGSDDIIGVLYARDLLGLWDDDAPARSCAEIARPPYFVPETKRVSELLRDMQHNRVHLAVVVDEYGGTAGLVTIEDLVEEIVGEIVDEYDRDEPMIIRLDDGDFLVDGRLDVDALAEIVQAEFPSEEWDTVGGLLLGLAGRVPREGEGFDYDGLRLTAERVQGRRVAKVRVARR